MLRLEVESGSGPSPASDIATDGSPTKYTYYTGIAYRGALCGKGVPTQRGAGCTVILFSGEIGPQR